MRQKKAFQSRNATERYSGAMFFIKFKLSRSCFWVNVILSWQLLSAHCIQKECLPQKLDCVYKIFKYQGCCWWWKEWSDNEWVEGISLIQIQDFHTSVLFVFPSLLKLRFFLLRSSKLLVRCKATLLTAKLGKVDSILIQSRAMCLWFKTMLQPRCQVNTNDD